MTVHESVDRDADKNAAVSGGSASGAGLGSGSDSTGSTGLLEAKSSTKWDSVFRSVTVAAGAVIVTLIALIGILAIVLVGTIADWSVAPPIFAEVAKLHHVKFIIPDDAAFATAIGATLVYK